MTSEQFKFILFAAAGFLGGSILVWLTYLFIYYVVHGYV